MCGGAAWGELWWGWQGGVGGTAASAAHPLPPPPSHPATINRQCRPCSKPLNRRFIVVEGLYANTGDLAPLEGLKALKEVRSLT